jgi:hypothetical protein
MSAEWEERMAAQARARHRAQQHSHYPAYLHFDGVEWSLRYGTPTREQLNVAASMIAAYKQLVEDPKTRRDAKVAGIRRALAAPPKAALPLPSALESEAS